MIACPLEHDREPRGRTERAGLELVWRSPHAVRLVYADQPLDGDLLDRLTAHP